VSQPDLVISLTVFGRAWGQDPEALPMTSSQREELDCRVYELEDEGPTGLSWDEVVAACPTGNVA